MRFGRRRFLRLTAVPGLIALRADVLAQPQTKVYHIGYPNLRAGPAELDEAFLQGMRDLGYVVGRNLVIEYRWASGDNKRFDAMADELVRLNVDVIVTSSTGAVLRAMQATRTIPIVMLVASDPVDAGLSVTDENERIASRGGTTAPNGSASICLAVMQATPPPPIAVRS